jgi:hypothetical protein
MIAIALASSALSSRACRRVAVGVVLVSTNIHLVYAFPPFALMQKVEPKIKASPNRSARLAAHAQQQSLQHSTFTYFNL